MGRVCYLGYYNAGTPYQCGCQTGYYGAYNNSYSYTNAGTYTASTAYDCNCQTCYPRYIRVLKSLASTVSTLTTWTIASVAQSLRIKTNGSEITVKAFSDTNLATQIGSDLVYTPSGVAITSTHGLIVYPSATNQGTTLGSTTIDKG
jgi:hypothetical protein